MGWNSWNRFQRNIDERLIRETAMAMVETGMRDAGYRYVVIDDAWEAPARGGDGELVADADRFPSGIPALAEFVHSLGMRFGIYTDAGTATCQGLPGSLGYEFRDARRFAAWGTDYVKVDWCHTDGLGPRAVYKKWSEAFRAAGRPMVLSICEWGRTRPWEWAPTVGHLWRTCWDIQDTWESLCAVLDRQVGLDPFAGPDHWNDPDMLEVGNGGMTEAEYRAHFSLWAILAAPLMAGNDIRSMSPAIREMLTAPEVLAVDQDPAGCQGRRIRASDGCEVWVRELAEPDAKAVVLLDRTGDAREIALSWQELDWAPSDRVAVRDLWERRDVGRFPEGYAATARAHDVVMLKLTRAPA